MSSRMNGKVSNSLLIARVGLILSFPEQGTNLQEAWRKLKGVQGERNSMSDESISVFFCSQVNFLCRNVSDA